MLRWRGRGEAGQASAGAGTCVSLQEGRFGIGGTKRKSEGNELGEGGRVSRQVLLEVQLNGR